MAKDSSQRLREALHAIPGAAEAFRRVLEDKKTEADLIHGTRLILAFPARAKAVGWLVAVAEIDDRDIRMAVAQAMQDAARQGKTEA